ncbi:hypothetical protein ANTQUA_LOCUS8070 [Anthophora quadrimaculata]
MTLSKHVESDRYNSIQNIPDEWRHVPSEYQPPKIEETVMNGNTGNEVEETDQKKNNKKKLHLGSRTVIKVPWIGCPSGQKRDYRGQCRDVVDLR